MKYALKDFEQHISVHTAAAAEGLLSSGAVRSMEEVERHFWVTKVADEDAVYETEVIITPSRIKAYTCDCWAEPRRLMCTHIAASLLKIRQYIQQKKEQRTEQARIEKTVSPERLNIGSMVEKADAETLRTFVRNYARENRDFSLALKTWLVGQLIHTGNPYALLLQSVFPKDSVLGKMREADARRLLATAQQLHIRMTAAFAEYQFNTVLQIAIALTEIWAALTDREETHKRHAAMGRIFRSASRHLLRLLLLPSPSPEIRQSAWQHFLGLVETRTLSSFNEEEIWPLLIAVGRQETCFQEVKVLFDRLPFPAPPFLLAWLTGIFADRKMPHLAVRHLQEYQHLVAYMYPILMQLHQEGLTETFAAAADTVLLHSPLAPWQRNNLEELRLEIARTLGDMEYVRGFAYKQLTEKGTFHHYEIWEAIQPTSEAEFATLTGDLSQRGHHATIARILAHEGRTEDLKILLLHTPLWPLTETYMGNLYTTDPEFVRTLYLQKLTAYLQEHLGRPASSFVRERLGVLLHKTSQPFIFEMMRTLATRFPERHTLPEELAELFPKMKPEKIFHA